ncbi:MAG: PAS domain-containing sensor histidine kinase [Methylococcales bacterium]|jgi:PAS domain S-box-containing protein|nr:PAS domain-containing sensor histidine kinase [Methylococcales bacterium]
MPNATLKSLEQALQDSEARYAKLKGEYLSTQQTTQELMAAQTLTQSMLNNAAEGMITFATDNTVMSFNHAAQNLLGAREVDVLHQQIDNLFEIPSDFDSITEYMRAYCQTHSDHEMLDDPLFALKADGTRVPLRVTISEVRSSDMVLFDEDESVDLFGDEEEYSDDAASSSSDVFFCMLHDLTGQRELKALVTSQQEALLRTSTIKDNFLSNVSHELLTPLNGIIPMADMLKDEDLTEVQYQYIDVIKTCSHDLKKVVTSILQFSNAQQKMAKLHIEAVNLDELKASALESYHHCRVNKKLDFQIVAEGVPNVLQIDKLRIFDALDRLIDNAVKFTEAGSVTVTIKVEPDSGYGLVLMVEDTGAGIEAARLPDIFNSFEQGDGSKTRQFGGMGLGLTLVNQSVTDLQGKITVTSEEGVGSSFTIYLPQQEKSDFQQHAEIDPTAFNAIADIMGEGVKAVLVGYLEETEQRIEQMCHADSNESLVATLRDTNAGSQQMGAMGLARQCSHLQADVETLSQEEKLDMITGIQEEFDRVKCDLTLLCEKVTS